MPYENGWKMKDGVTCAHDAEFVARKGKKTVEFWPKPVGGYPTKMPGESCIRKLVPMKANLWPCRGKSVEFWLKPLLAEFIGLNVSS